MFKAFSLKVWNQSHLTFVAIASVLGGRNSSPENARRQHHHALQVQGTAAILTTTVEYPSSVSLGRPLPVHCWTGLQTLTERVYPEAQCRFRAETSTIDKIFKLRQLQEKCQGQRKPLYIAFIDLTKAFYPVFRKGLSDLLQRFGCPHKLQRMIAFSVKEPSSTKGSTSDPFPFNSGVKLQGCVLAPTLLSILFSSYCCLTATQ